MKRFQPSVGSVPFALDTSNVAPFASVIPGNSTCVRMKTVKLPTLERVSATSTSGSPGHHPRISQRRVADAPGAALATHRPVCIPDRLNAPSTHLAGFEGSHDSLALVPRHVPRACSVRMRAVAMNTPPFSYVVRSVASNNLTSAPLSMLATPFTLSATEPTAGTVLWYPCLMMIEKPTTYASTMATME